MTRSTPSGPSASARAPVRTTSQPPRRRTSRSRTSTGTCTPSRTTGGIPEDKADRQQVIRRVYVDALRDWVRNGENSEYALSADEVRRKVRQPTEEDARAAAHVRLGRRLYRGGHVETAKRHLREAVRLCPQKWNYRRQSMALDPELVGQINVTPEYWEAFDAIGDATYYPAADMPGMPR